MSITIGSVGGDGHDIRERHLGRIAGVEPNAPIVVDVGALVRRLILFEKCVLESVRLKEVAALVSVFGARGLIDLLDDGALEIVCDAVTIGEIGRTDLKVTDRRGRPLTPGNYRLAAVSAADREEYLHLVLQEVHRARIRFPEVKRLKKELARRLLRYPRAAAESAVISTQAEVVARPEVVAEAIRRLAATEIGHDPGPLRIRAEPLPFEGDMRVWTSLSDQTGIAAEIADDLVRRGLLAAAQLNQRIYLMEHFRAVTGFSDSELPLFASKLSFLANAVDPAAQEARFDRVLSITGLPDLQQLAPGIAVDKLLELRSRAEIRDFRAWLRGVDTETDEEIEARFSDVRSRYAAVLQSAGGRAVRFLVTGAVGLAGIIPGVAASAADTFLLDRLFGRPGPAAFIGRWYPSLFRREEPDE